MTVPIARRALWMALRIAWTAIALVVAAYALAIAHLVGEELRAASVTGFAAAGCLFGLVAAIALPADDARDAFGHWLGVWLVAAGGVLCQTSFNLDVAEYELGTLGPLASATTMAAIGVAGGFLAVSRWSVAVAVAVAGAFALLIPTGDSHDAIPLGEPFARAALWYCGPWLLAALGAETGVYAARLSHTRPEAERA